MCGTICTFYIFTSEYPLPSLYHMEHMLMMVMVMVVVVMVMLMMAMVMMVMVMIILISGHMPGAANHTHQPDKSEAGKEREAAQCRFSEPVPSWCRLVRDLIK